MGIFACLLPALAAAHQVIAVELQGHGHTADIGRALPYRQTADDTAVLLRALGVERVDVAGYSMGGGVALQLAIGPRRPWVPAAYSSQQGDAV